MGFVVADRDREGEMGSGTDLVVFYLLRTRARAWTETTLRADSSQAKSSRVESTLAQSSSSSSCSNKKLAASSSFLSHAK